MKPTRPKTVPYRRKREVKTNYTKRLTLLLSGKPRLVVRLTNTQVLAQVAEFTLTGDKIIAAASGSDLRKLGWQYSTKNLPAAYLTGFLIGKRAVKKGCKESILDTGNVSPIHKGRFYAFLKGALDAGFQVPFNLKKDIFAEEERIMGKHIIEHAPLVQKGSRQYTQYLKSGALPENISKQFQTIKQKIN
ncbi:50S ribosomal protein L18 [Candidatus Woesearchaeota archaeon]|nr:50S ribosomal protein L18 [Candidatus Woesearchaeota archaeon]